MARRASTFESKEPLFLLGGEQIDSGTTGCRAFAPRRARYFKTQGTRSFRIGGHRGGRLQPSIRSKMSAFVRGFGRNGLARAHAGSSSGIFAPARTPAANAHQHPPTPSKCTGRVFTTRSGGWSSSGGAAAGKELATARAVEESKTEKLVLPVPQSNQLPVPHSNQLITRINCTRQLTTRVSSSR